MVAVTPRLPHHDRSAREDSAHPQDRAASKVEDSVADLLVRAVASEAASAAAIEAVSVVDEEVSAIKTEVVSEAEEADMVHNPTALAVAPHHLPMLPPAQVVVAAVVLDPVGMVQVRTAANKVTKALVSVQ